MSVKFPVKIEFSAIDKLTGSVKQINDRIATAVQPLKSVNARFAAFGDALNLKGVSESFGRVTAAAAGVRAAISGALMTAGLFATAVVGGAYGIVKGYADAASSVLDTSKKLGIGIEALQELRFAAEQSGVEAEAFDTSMKILAKNSALAAAGTGDAVKVFKALGVSVKDASGRVRTTEALLPELADKFKNIQSASLRTALAMKIFGKGGADMALLLGEGSAEIAKIRQQARDLNIVMGEQAVRKGEAFGDTLSLIGRVIGGVRNAIGAELLPVFSQMADDFIKFVGQNMDGIRAFGQQLGVLVGVVVSVIAVVAKLAATMAWAFNLLPQKAQVAIITAAVAAFGALLAGSVTVAVVKFAASVVAALPVLITFGLQLLSISSAFAVQFSLGLASGAGAMKSVAAGLWAMLAPLRATALAIITHPLFWIPAAIAAVVASIYLLWKNWDAVSAFFKNNFDMKDAFLALTGPIGWLIIAARKVMDNWAPVKEFFAGLIPDSVKSFFGGDGAEAGPAAGAQVAGAAGAMSAIRDGAVNRTESTVKIDFNNLPRGTQVSPGRNNEVPLDLGLGYAGVF